MRAVIGLAMFLVLFSATLSAKGQQGSADFQPPQVISTVEPSYPANSVTGGTVVLKVTVGANGEIEDVRVVQEARGFTKQAIEAVRKWKFEAAKLDGKPLAASIPVAFSFSQPIVWWSRQAK